MARFYSTHRLGQTRGIEKIGADMFDTPDEAIPMAREAVNAGPATAEVDLVVAPERPLIASVVWPTPNISVQDHGLVADMETCLAAAFFEPDA